MLRLAKIEPQGRNPAHWKKGQSGNPGGRRVEQQYGVENIAALARAHAPEAIKTLVMCLRDPRYKLAAAVALLDRGYGKPHVAIHTQSESTVLHLIAAEAVGNTLVGMMEDQSVAPTIDAISCSDDTPPTE